MNPLLRSASALALFAAALSASAQSTAYSSLGYAGNSGGVGDNFPNGPYSEFASGLSGVLSGFQVQIDNFDTVPVSFNVTLYSSVPAVGAGTDTVGAQIAAFTGTVAPSNATVLVSVPASGVALVSGTKYWLGLSGGTKDASGIGNQAWFHATTGAPTTTTRVYDRYAANAAPYAFAVQATPQATPEPSALAALGVGGLAVLRRRKRA